MNFTVSSWVGSTRVDRMISPHEIYGSSSSSSITDGSARAVSFCCMVDIACVSCCSCARNS